MEKDPRLTEADNPATVRIDRASAREIVELINSEDARVAPAVARESEAIARLIDEVERRIRIGGRLIYVGAGTSGRLGVLDASECPPTFGTDPELVRGVIAGGTAALVESQEGAEDDEAAGGASIDALGVGSEDFVLGIAASATTPFVLAALTEARERGARTGILTFTPPPESLARLADVAVTPLVGPEVIAGSTRMKAGTATKLVLNTLSTGLMVRLGKVHRNLMVDLLAVSRKLVDRSVRIVREVGGVDEDVARQLLVAAGGSSKTAIAMHELRASRAVAERVVDECNGSLGEAIERFADGPLPYYAGYPETFDDEATRLLAARLRAAPDRLRRAVEHEAPPERRISRWRAREHLAHLIECETVTFRPRVERILESEEPRFENWEPSPDPPAGEGPGRLLEIFRNERTRTCALLEPLSGRAWGRFAAIGDERVTLYQFLRGVAHHDEAHAVRIRERIHSDLVRSPAGSESAVSEPRS
ncbi:MAG: N-acetylmuramic acid 6-phosphate etherase [Gemmatimonadales bacterium]